MTMRLYPTRRERREHDFLAHTTGFGDLVYLLEDVAVGRGGYRSAFALVERRSEGEGGEEGEGDGEELHDGV